MHALIGGTSRQINSIKISLVISYHSVFNILYSTGCGFRHYSPFAKLKSCQYDTKSGYIFPKLVFYSSSKGVSKPRSSISLDEHRHARTWVPQDVSHHSFPCYDDDPMTPAFSSHHQWVIHCSAICHQICYDNSQ